ncbi:MAG TPA: hypothetical protein VG125_13635 [Pirellulales bacterium]|nr:hypothetical protein [Pirellulales bacterium]
MPAEGPIKSVPVSSVTGSNQTLVAAVPAAGLEPNQKIRIRSLALSITSAGTVTFHDNAGSPVTLLGPLNIATTSALVLPDNPEGWGDTTANQALQVDVSAGAINGELTYQLID